MAELEETVQIRVNAPSQQKESDGVSHDQERTTEVGDQH